MMYGSWHHEDQIAPSTFGAWHSCWGDNHPTSVQILKVQSTLEPHKHICEFWLPGYTGILPWQLIENPQYWNWIWYKDLWVLHPMMIGKLQIIWKVPICRMMLRYLCLCFHTASATLANTAWSNISTMVSRSSCFMTSLLHSKISAHVANWVTVALMVGKYPTLYTSFAPSAVGGLVSQRLPLRLQE